MPALFLGNVCARTVRASEFAAVPFDGDARGLPARARHLPPSRALALPYEVVLGAASEPVAPRQSAVSSVVALARRRGPQRHVAPIATAAAIAAPPPDSSSAVEGSGISDDGSPSSNCGAARSHDGWGAHRETGTETDGYGDGRGEAITPDAVRRFSTYDASIGATGPIDGMLPYDDVGNGNGKAASIVEVGVGASVRDEELRSSSRSTSRAKEMSALQRLRGAGDKLLRRLPRGATLPRPLRSLSRSPVRGRVRVRRAPPTTDCNAYVQTVGMELRPTSRQRQWGRRRSVAPDDADAPHICGDKQEVHQQLLPLLERQGKDEHQQQQQQLDNECASIPSHVVTPPSSPPAVSPARGSALAPAPTSPVLHEDEEQQLDHGMPQLTPPALSSSLSDRSPNTSFDDDNDGDEGNVGVEEEEEMEEMERRECAAAVVYNNGSGEKEDSGEKLDTSPPCTPTRVTQVTQPAVEKSECAVPEFVTIRRLVKRVLGDGTVQMVRYNVHVRPERVLPGGDVVIKRKVRRAKDDGTGMETLTVMQVIPRRRADGDEDSSGAGASAGAPTTPQAEADGDTDATTADTAEKVLPTSEVGSGSDGSVKTERAGVQGAVELAKGGPGDAAVGALKRKKTEGVGRGRGRVKKDHAADMTSSRAVAGSGVEAKSSSEENDGVEEKLSPDASSRFVLMNGLNREMERHVGDHVSDNGVREGRACVGGGGEGKARVDVDDLEDEDGASSLPDLFLERRGSCGVDGDKPYVWSCEGAKRRSSGRSKTEMLAGGGAGIAGGGGGRWAEWRVGRAAPSREVRKRKAYSMDRGRGKATNGGRGAGAGSAAAGAGGCESACASGNGNATGSASASGSGSGSRLWRGNRRLWREERVAGGDEGARRRLGPLPRVLSFQSFWRRVAPVTEAAGDV